MGTPLLSSMQCLIFSPLYDQHSGIRQPPLCSTCMVIDHSRRSVCHVSVAPSSATALHSLPPTLLVLTEQRAAPSAPFCAVCCFRATPGAATGVNARKRRLDIALVAMPTLEEAAPHCSREAIGALLAVSANGFSDTSPVSGGWSSTCANRRRRAFVLGDISATEPGI